MNTATFKYKCRLCGKTYSGASTSEELAQMVLLCTTSRREMPGPLIGKQPELIETHHGCKVGYGVSDLIGYTTKPPHNG